MISKDRLGGLVDEVRRFTVYLYRMPTERELLEVTFCLLSSDYEINSVGLYEKGGSTGMYAITFQARITSREHFMVWLRWRLWYLESRGIENLIVHPQ